MITPITVVYNPSGDPDCRNSGAGASKLGSPIGTQWWNEGDMNAKSAPRARTGGKI